MARERYLEIGKGLYAVEVNTFWTPADLAGADVTGLCGEEERERVITALLNLSMDNNSWRGATIEKLLQEVRTGGCGGKFNAEFTAQVIKEMIADGLLVVCERGVRGWFRGDPKVVFLSAEAVQMIRDKRLQKV